MAVLYVRVRLNTRRNGAKGVSRMSTPFRNGKAIQFRTFADEQQALEWAGVEASDAN